MKIFFSTEDISLRWSQYLGELNGPAPAPTR